VPRLLLRQRHRLQLDSEDDFEVRLGERADARDRAADGGRRPAAGHSQPIPGEAVTLSLIGGVLGIAVGLGGAHAIGHFAERRTLIAVDAVFVAFGFAAAVGILFGFYPGS